jgi:hypothetical protein
MKIEKVSIKDIKMNPNNPRVIKDEKFKKLVKSIKEFPEMLDVRPIVVDDSMIVLGGNMRLRACLESGIKEVSIIKFKNISEDKKKEFIIKDNVGYGEWDFDMLMDEWKSDNLVEWELDIDKNFDIFKEPQPPVQNDYSQAPQQPVQNNYQQPQNNYPPSTQPTTDNDFSPNVLPTTNYRDVTQEDMNRAMSNINSNIATKRTFIDCMCPECGAEFSIDNL